MKEKKKSMYSFATISIQPLGWSPLKSNAGGQHGTTPTKNVVCCCPWSGSGSGFSFGSDSSISKQENTSLKKVNKKLPLNLPLPPGPSPLHLLGLLHYSIRSLPFHHALTDLAKTFGPLLHFKVGQLSTVVVSSAEIAAELLKGNDVACANRPKTKVSRVMSYDYSDIVTSPYGDYWKQIRHICIAELLSAKNVRSFDYIRKEQGSILIEAIRSAPRFSPFNLTEKIFDFMNAATCRAVFGNVSMDRAHTIMLIRRSMAAAGSVELADIFPSIELFNLISFKAYDDVSEAKPEMDRILDDVIEKHKRNVAATGKGYGEESAEDFIDVLLRLKERDHHLLQFPLTDDTIKALIFDMFVGGTESASSAVEWTMAELVRNPIIMAKLQAEIREAFRGRKTMEESEIQKLSYLKVVVKESLRLHPPNAFIPRSCSEDLEIEGYCVPRDAFILVNVWWLGRDPRNWREPEKFEPERFEGNSVGFLGNHFEYIPFGAGKRICPAITFAVANVEFLLAQLLYYYDWKLPVGMRVEDLDMTETGSFSISRKSSLNLIATPYAPAFAQV